jgi:mannosyltransferase
MKTNRIYSLILIIILIFSGLIYFYRLGSESLSTDEYFSLYVAQKSPQAIISDHKKAVNPNTIPPLYELILHYWMKIFGQTEFAQRALSAFFGILSVYFLYLLGSLFFNSRTGLLSALFGALSYNWFSLFRQNRCYGLFILLTLISFYCFFNLIKNRNTKHCFVYLAVANSLLLYTHYFAVLIVLLQLIFGIFEWRKDKKFLSGIILACVFSALAYLPWITNLIFDLNREPIITDKPPVVSAARVIFDILRILFSDFHFIWSPILTVIYIPFIIMGIIKLKKVSFVYSKHAYTYLILILVVPFIFLYGYLFTDRTRYYAPFMFPLFILLAYGILRFNIRTLTRKALLTCASVFIISNNFMDFSDFYNTPSDEEWKQTVALIKHIPDYRDKINVFILQTHYNPPIFSYYYWEPKTAASFIDNIANKYDNGDISSIIGSKDKLLVIEDMWGREFFNKLALFPDDAWIWIFRYHDLVFSKDFKVQNSNRYFFHQIKLNKELVPIDLFLLRKNKNG